MENKKDEDGFWYPRQTFLLRNREVFASGLQMKRSHRCKALPPGERNNELVLKWLRSCTLFREQEYGSAALLIPSPVPGQKMYAYAKRFLIRFQILRRKYPACLLQ